MPRELGGMGRYQCSMNGCQIWHTKLKVMKWRLYMSQWTLCTCLLHDCRLTVKLLDGQTYLLSIYYSYYIPLIHYTSFNIFLYSYYFHLWFRLASNLEKACGRQVSQQPAEESYEVSLNEQWHATGCHIMENRTWSHVKCVTRCVSQHQFERTVLDVESPRK